MLQLANKGGVCVLELDSKENSESSESVMDFRTQSGRRTVHIRSAVRIEKRAILGLSMRKESRVGLREHQFSSQ
jgi:hypothetical protein